MEIGIKEPNFVEKEMRKEIANRHYRKVQWYMTLAYMMAMKSKDPRTKLGAVVIGLDGETRSTGYNGIPRGVLDIESRMEGEEKYKWIEHAERNCVFNASLSGTSLKGCEMYTQQIPCSDCARAIVQSGIKKVIIHDEWNRVNTTKWVEDSVVSRAMFQESGVVLVEWSGKLLELSAMHSGNILELETERIF